MGLQIVLLGAWCLVAFRIHAMQIRARRPKSLSPKPQAEKSAFRRRVALSAADEFFLLSVEASKVQETLNPI